MNILAQMMMMMTSLNLFIVSPVGSEHSFTVLAYQGLICKMWFGCWQWYRCCGVKKPMAYIKSPVFKNAYFQTELSVFFFYCEDQVNVNLLSSPGFAECES